MFKKITRDSITAAEIKKRIFAYVYCQPESESSSTAAWHGSINTYTLNLRLSGVYSEKPVTSSCFREQDYQAKSLKYPYFASEIFIHETDYLNQPEFVRFVYQTFLGREADPDGFAINLQQLQTGVSRSHVVRVVRNSEEAQSFFLNLTDCLSDQAFSQLLPRIYRHLHDGDLELPDGFAGSQGETLRSQILQKWQQFEKLQVALAGQEQDFGCSDSSFLSRSEKLTNADFIRQLYLSYLKREADPEGLQSQVVQLESGTSRSQVLLNLRTSTEAINRFVDLTSSVDNITFIELAYRFYFKAKLSPTQKQLDLETLESGLGRPAILAARQVDQIDQVDQSDHWQDQGKMSSVISDRSELNKQISLSDSDRHRILQQWQVSDAEFVQRTDNLNNSEFVNQAYQFFLQRNLKQTELDLQQQQFAQGRSRLEFLDRVRRSPAAAHLFIQVTQDLNHQQFLEAAYSTYFQQELDPTDQLVYLQFLERGNPRLDILA